MRDEKRMTPKRVGIFIFPNVEVLDFCGPFEVFSVTRRQRGDATSPFEVLLVAETNEVVRTVGGMQVVPHVTFADCPPLDILVVPGGVGTRPLLNQPTVLQWVQEQATAVETLTSVCTGSLILAQAGLLDGLTATTHWTVLDEMARRFPAVQVDYAQHWLEEAEGRIFTSAGIAAGIDMALQVVAKYEGEAVARETAKQMEYPYPTDNRRRISF
jgi:transcriptional regulator GlxA family with amidase domain